MFLVRNFSLATLLLLTGCSNDRPTTMLPAIDVPKDRATIHPWIADLIEADTASVTVAIRNRMSKQTSEHVAPMVSMVEEFVPRRIEFSRGIGYVLCVKRSTSGKVSGDVTDQLYIAQPLPRELIDGRIAFFDESIRLMMKEFLAKFSGCGEEMEGHAGQFVLADDAPASEIAYYQPEKLGEWQSARLLYAARNGDSVFINRSGATAWHVFETNELLPLFGAFPEFIRHYVEFRNSPEVFDSWTSRDFLERNP